MNVPPEITLPWNSWMFQTCSFVAKTLHPKQLRGQNCCKSSKVYFCHVRKYLWQWLASSFFFLGPHKIFHWGYVFWEGKFQLSDSKPRLALITLCGLLEIFHRPKASANHRLRTTDLRRWQWLIVHVSLLKWASIRSGAELSFCCDWWLRFCSGIIASLIEVTKVNNRDK